MTQEFSIATTPPSVRAHPDRPMSRLDPLRAVAVEFEAVFLAEMLSHSGLGRPPAGFGGGAGEEAFGGFLLREQARLLAASGAIGLADAIEASIARSRHGPKAQGG